MNPLLFLLSFLRIQVAGDPEPDPVPDDEPTPSPEPEAQPELDLESPDPEPEPKADPKAELEAARREARESKERAERFEREAAELRIRSAPRPTDDQTAREDAILNDPNARPEDKWKVGADRTLRQNNSVAQATLFQAQDTNDRTAFASLCMSSPIAKRYETRVEDELRKARAAGLNPRREDIFTYQLGKDMREGKFKKAKAASPAAPVRGKTPGVKSDVSAKGGMSEHEKRRARLENTPI